MKLLSFWIALSVLLVSCGIPNQSEIGSGGESAVETKPVTQRRSRFKLLPKAMTAEERRRAKELIQNQPQTIASYADAPTGKIRTPAEFEPMEGVLVRVANDELFDDFFGNLVKGILQAKAVPYLVYYNDDDKNEIIEYSLMPKGITANQVQWVQSSFDAFWSRDYGPWHIYVDGKRSIVDMKYYPTRVYDDFISMKLGKLWNEDLYKAHLYVEGGNFMTDGKGTCWTSTGIFDFNHLSPTQLSSLYRQFMGCQKTHFPPPLYMEGTTHIDMFSKILDENTIMVAQSKAEWGANSNEINSLEEIARFYATNTNTQGKLFKVVRIPMGFATIRGERVYYAYTNSTIVNQTVLVPLYGLPIEQAALQVYKDNMKNHTILGISNGQSIIPYGGSVHCTTMQIPKNTDTMPADSLIKTATDTKTDTLTQGTWKLYGPYTATQGEFKVAMTGTGDADLYVWKDVEKDKMTHSNFACSPYNEDSYERCSVEAPGTFYVGVFSTTASSTVQLRIEYSP